MCTRSPRPLKTGPPLPIVTKRVFLRKSLVLQKGPGTNPQAPVNMTYQVTYGILFASRASRKMTAREAI